MPNLEPLFYLNFESAGSDQYSTNEDNDGIQRLPPDYLFSGNHDTNLAPYIDDFATGFGFNLKGFHANLLSTNGGRASAIYYDPNKLASVELASFIMVRSFGGFINFGVGPAVRIQTAANPGRSCYSAELIWVTSGPDGYFRLEICKYDAAGTRTTLGTLNNAITKYPVNSSPANFGNRYYAVGLKAEGTGGTVTLKAFLHMMYFTQDPTYNPFAPGTTPPRNLKSLPPTTTVVLTATDSSTPLTTGSVGVRWRDAATAADIYNSLTQSRLVLEHAIYKDIAGTRPVTPQVVSVTCVDGTRATVLLQGFSDPNPTNTHDSTRWLLLEDEPTGMVDIPTRDTGFQTAYKVSYTFTDLAPGKRYKVQAQFKDSDGDVSVLSTPYIFQVATGRPRGYLHGLDWHESMARSSFPRNSVYDILGRGGMTVATPVFKLRNSGFVVSGSPVQGRGPTLRRFNSVGAGLTRGFAYRDPTLIPGQPNSRYLQIMATMVFVRWGDASGLHIGVRSTAADIDGYYVKKQSNGSNWDYVVYQRSLNAGGTPNVGPFTNTTVFTGSILKTKVGLQGERLILASYDVGGTPNLALFVNGILLGSASGSAVSQGYSDPGHMYSAIMVDDTNGDWDIMSYGQVDAISGNFPQLPLTIYTPTRNTGAVPGGTAMSQPGPYMDPFDLGDSFTAWFTRDGRWCYQDPTGGIAGFLVYWAPYLETYDYTVRATIYNNAGLVARFTDPYNYIVVYCDIGNSLVVVAFVVNNVVVQYHHARITYTDGSDLYLQVGNDISAGSTAILVRVYYAGALLLFGPAGGGSPFVNSYVSYDGGSASPLRSGRPGIVRNSQRGSSTGEYVAANFSVVDATAVNPPNQPSIASKSGDACTKVSVVLNASSFTDPDATSVHQKSQWQIALASDPSFSAPIFDSGATSSYLTAITVSPAVGTWTPNTNPGLNALTTYLARVRFQDDLGLWSSWSTTFVFVTDNVTSTSQTSGVLGTFPTDPKPAQTFDEEVQFNTLVNQYESSRGQGIQKWTTYKTVFRLVYGPITSDQMDILWSFFTDTMKGRLNLVTFIHPRTGQAHVVRSLQDNMSRSMFEWLIERTGLSLAEA